MTRYEGPLGSFDAPDGWALLPGVGAAEDAPEHTFRRSVVLSGEALDAPCDPAAYLVRQRVLVEATLVGVSALVVTPAPAPGAAWTMSYEVDPPDDEPFAQRQAYVFEGGRVQVLTLTTRVEDPDAPSLLSRAVETLGPPPPPPPAQEAAAT